MNIPREGLFGQCVDIQDLKRCDLLAMRTVMDNTHLDPHGILDWIGCVVHIFASAESKIWTQQRRSFNPCPRQLSLRDQTG